MSSEHIFDSLEYMLQHSMQYNLTIRTPCYICGRQVTDPLQRVTKLTLAWSKTAVAQSPFLAATPVFLCLACDFTLTGKPTVSQDTSFTWKVGRV